MLDGALYLMSGGGESSDWVKNIKANGEVRVRIGKAIFAGRGELAPTGVDELVIRERMAEKYQGWRPGLSLSQWAREALVVRIALNETAR